MEAIKKYWWLILLVPVVLYMIYIMTKETNGKPKPGSPEYAREAKAVKAILKTEQPETDGTDSGTGKGVDFKD